MAPRRPKPASMLEDAIQSILEDEVVAPLVVKAARVPGKDIIKVVQPTIVSIRDQIIKIQTEADPIQFMINIQNGALFENVILTETDGVPGKLIFYEQPNLKQRIEAAKYLANKVLPTLSVQKHIVERPDESGEEAELRPGQPGQPSFSQLVSAAASKAQEAARALPDHRVIYETVEPIVDDDQIRGSTGYIAPPLEVEEVAAEEYEDDVKTLPRSKR
jgi:hypothetical protein